jgi:hypothetical protein
MELRLLIPVERNRVGWSVELVIPPCRKCPATVTLDVGGREQTLDMRGMEKHRHVTAELSEVPYRIVSFSGDPDPLFVSKVSKECPGLPTFGAAAFDASGRGELKGFPRAKKLRESETFAMLWRQPAEPDFHEELVVDRLCGRQGWNLALVTLPDSPSKGCAAWLWSFTQLALAPPKPSIIPIWPFLTKNSSVNEVECVRTDTVLLSAGMMPVENWHIGPNMEAQSASAFISDVGVERSPAFFALKPEATDFVRVSVVQHPEFNHFFSFPLRQELSHSQRLPSIEMSFITPEGVRHIVPLHQPKCTEVVAEARRKGIRPEYLSMPPGARGSFLVDGPAGRSEEVISSGCNASPHNQQMRLPDPNILIKLISALVDPACYVEIEFGGFGRMYLAGTKTRATVRSGRGELSPALRSRLLSFMLQLRLSSPAAMQVDDFALVEALGTAQPESRLIPHYRSLVREVLASGFELKHLGEGVSS